MIDQSHLSESDLKQLLHSDVDSTDQANVESHLEQCEQCQAALQRCVAEEQWWNHAAEVLDRTTDVEIESMGESSSVSVVIDPSVHFPNASEASGRAWGGNFSQHEMLLDAPTQPDSLGRVGTFAVERLIGRGGMGVVYKGFDADLNRPVAIKFLAPHLSGNQVARQRFARESRAAAAVVHPNVVPIYSVDASRDRPYIVMAWVSGRSVQKYVTDSGPIAVTDAVRIGQQIAAGLSAAHLQGLVHRDIKPGNVLLEKEVSRVMITDFGLARAVDEASLTQSGLLAGTPHYMSPEQAEGQPIDPRSDLFSLGSVMYFMLTGQEPFQAEKPYAVLRKIISQKPPSIRILNPDVPVLLEQFVFRLLAKEPKHRFESAEEANQFLVHYLAHLQDPKTHKKPRLENRKKRLALASVVAIAVASLSLAWSIGVWSDLPKNETTTNVESTETVDSDSARAERLAEQPPRVWASEAQGLNTEIEILEQKPWSPFQPFPRVSSDNFEAEIQDLKAAIEAMEQSFP